MALGLVGRKIGMTRLFSATGEATPVTVLEVTANRVPQVKDEAKDGYRAVQLTNGSRRADRLAKAIRRQYAQAGMGTGRGWPSADGRGARPRGKGVDGAGVDGWRGDAS